VSASARVLNAVARRGRIARLGTRAHVALLRASRGRLLGRWAQGSPVIVLETVGRRSGQPRATPVIYLEHGDAFVVTAANAGAERTPAWWHNLTASGRAHVVARGRRVPVRLRVPEAGERERLWARFVERYPMLDDYREFTDRELPLAVLEPER
jgi:F420H(2)-dependent quinone reductase